MIRQLDVEQKLALKELAEVMEKHNIVINPYYAGMWVGLKGAEGKEMFDTYGDSMDAGYIKEVLGMQSL